MTDNKDNDGDILLDESTVNYVLHFANALSGGATFPYGNAINPMLLNQRLKDINLNPLQATEAKLTDALNDPKNSEIALQSFSQDFEIQSQVYKKLLSYLGTMLAFDMTYSCTNAKTKDYKTREYSKDLDVLKRFVDKFDYKHEFSMAVQEMLRNEAYFACPRFDLPNRIVLQELPSSPTYTMITGRWDYGLLFSLNLYWFVQPGVDLDMYPDFLKRKYSELWLNGNGIKAYDPSLSPLMRGGSSWVYWQDIPVDVGWAFKFNPSIATRVPYYSGLFLDLIQQPQMRALQKSVNMAAAARIIVGEVPLLNNPQAKIKDQFSISSKNLGEFLSLVKSAVGESIRPAAMPLENIQGVSFPAENGIYSSYLKTALATSGVNTNLIFTSDVRPNAIESQLSLNVDENQMFGLYPQFEKFMNYHVNRMTKNFKFDIKFEGSSFFNNRQQRFDKYTALASNGIVLPQKIAASIGMNPFEFQRQLEEAQETGWVDKLTPIISGFQQSQNGEKTGRPQKKDGELSDSGENTRTGGNNIEKGGSV